MLSFENIQHYSAFIFGQKRFRLRKERAQKARHLQLLKLLASGRFSVHDIDDLALELNVTRRTIYRDIKVLEEDIGRCTKCGQVLPAVTSMMEIDD